MKKISAKDKLAAFEQAAARISFHKAISGQQKSINAIVNTMAAWSDAEALADRMKGTEHAKQADQDAGLAFELFRASYV